LAPITLNKNEQQSCKNLDVMIGTTNLQLPKYAIKTITFAKSRSTSPPKMEKKLVNEQEEPLNTQRKLDPKSLPNTNAPFLQMCKVQLRFLC
jgi:hypothetical protein